MTLRGSSPELVLPIISSRMIAALFTGMLETLPYLFERTRSNSVLT